MQSAEIELKFTVNDTAALERKLPAMGFVLQTPRTHERNVLYDTPDRSLRERHQLLRIRQYGEFSILTHKQSPADADDSRYKTRIESETRVEDGNALRTIFIELGYGPVFTYEKFRTEWRFPLPSGPAHLVVDETPIGTWAELEGPIAWIDEMLAKLGIDRDRCTTESYGRLFLLWKESTGSPADNLTFEEVQTAGARR